MEIDLGGNRWIFVVVGLLALVVSFSYFGVNPTGPTMTNSQTTFLSTITSTNSFGSTVVSISTSTSIFTTTTTSFTSGSVSVVSNVPYTNLRFTRYLYFLPGAPVNHEGGGTPGDAYTIAAQLRSEGINGIRADSGMSWPWYDQTGASNWKSGINYVATAFDQKGISVVWALPLPDQALHMPPDLAFYAESPPDAFFGGTGGSVFGPFNSLFQSNAIYWGKTTNTQYTASNGTVIPAGKFSWPWAAKYQGLPIWQVYAQMMADTIPTLIQHKATLGLKLWNEPFNYGWSSANLASYDSYMGQQIRSLGYTGYIVYGDYTNIPSLSDIQTAAPKSTSGTLLTPLMFEFHYPSLGDLSNVQNAMNAMGGAPNMEGWDGEDWVSYLNGANGGQPTAQQQATYGITAAAFGMSYAYPPPSDVQLLISSFNAGYGQPLFFA